MSTFFFTHSFTISSSSKYTSTIKNKRWRPTFVLLGSSSNRSSSNNINNNLSKRFAIKSTSLRTLSTTSTTTTLTTIPDLLLKKPVDNTNSNSNNISPILYNMDQLTSMDISVDDTNTSPIAKEELTDGGASGVSGLPMSGQQSMDISLGSSSATPNAEQLKDNGNELQISPLKSVEGGESLLPLEGQQDISSSSAITAGENDEDVEMNKSTEDSYPTIGACKSIEEASVNTTIECPLDDDEENGIDKEMLQSTLSTDISMQAEESPTEQTTPSNQHHNVKLCLTPAEIELFTLLTNAAEVYESGKLCINPNPTNDDVSARGGFTKLQSSSTINKDGTEKETEEKSWLKLPPKINQPIQIRIAGGWVRDKIINQHSVDVDVALDCMMGVQFARIVQAYLALENGKKEKEEMEGGVNGDSVMKEQQDIEEQKQAEAFAALPPSKQGGGGSKAAKKQKKKNKQPKIGVIGANPSQSKHLETATMNIHGIDIDFVNLRAEEVYELNSRIPTSKTKMFGSPLEDALRRDFTINSLFYNVRTNKIEDWTGRGLDDLIVHRRIVTPVDAHTTFHDDPLRILRAIRFCVRLDFTLDDEIVQAAMSKRVHHSLHVKVSRERVGKELEGMLTGKHAKPGQALDMIADLHLAGSVFAFPGSFPGDSSDLHASGPVTGNILGVPYNCSLGTDTVEAVEKAVSQRAMGWEESSKLLSVLPTVIEGHIDERESITREKKTAKETVASLPSTVVDTRLLHLCIFILPFHNLTFPDKKGREVSVTSQMIKEALKFPVRDIQAVSKILSHVDELATILSEIRSELEEAQNGQGGDAPFKLRPPCRLRAGLLLRSLKETWVTCLLTAAAWEIRSYQRLDNGSAEAASAIPLDQPAREFYRAIVDDLALDECWKVPPHLNGKEIIKELILPKGPIVGVYLDDQTRWMLLNPDGTKEECKAHLQERKRDRESQESSGSEHGGAKHISKKICPET